MLRNEVIPTKESTQFLGMTLDSRLNWEEHINKLRAKAKKYYKGSSKNKWGGVHKTLKKLNNVISRTKIDYCCQLYNTASAVGLKKLDSIHREGLRIYTGALRTLPVEALHVEANDRPLELRSNKLRLRFLYKLKSNTS